MELYILNKLKKKSSLKRTSEMKWMQHAGRLGRFQCSFSLAVAVRRLPTEQLLSFKKKERHFSGLFSIQTFVNIIPSVALVSQSH